MPTSPVSTVGAITGAFISAIIGCAINYFLYKFSTMTRDGLNNMNQVQLNQGLNNLSTYFKVLGIILLIVLIILGLAVVIIAFSAALSRR
jgi:glucan phosphoethanolaminetransferase (alkaline phosphatase superfamily)